MNNKQPVEDQILLKFKKKLFLLILSAIQPKSVCESTEENFRTVFLDDMANFIPKEQFSPCNESFE